MFLRKPMFNKEYYKTLILIPIFTGIIFLIVGCNDDNQTGLEGFVDVGIYAGYGAWDVSVIAMLNAVEAAGYEMETFDEDYIFRENLNRYRIIILPGGDPRDYSTAFGSIGSHRIRNYIEFGGGFIGFGGGAAVADADSGQWCGIGLFGGNAVWPVNRIAPYPEYTMTDIRLLDGHDTSIGSNDYYTTLYRWGPEFHKIDPYSVRVIFTYALTDTPAIIVFPYGAGIVVLAGCQLEIEENDDRDGVEFAEELDDPDTEWDLIEEIIVFCTGDF